LLSGLLGAITALVLVPVLLKFAGVHGVGLALVISCLIAMGAAHAKIVGMANIAMPIRLLAFAVGVGVIMIMGVYSLIGMLQTDPSTLSELMLLAVAAGLYLVSVFYLLKKGGARFADISR